MTTATDWTTGPDAWAAFVKQHPELGYREGRWQFHNFLRHFRDDLKARDAIRLAKGRHWIGHRDRFAQAAFDLATGFKAAGPAAPHPSAAGTPATPLTPVPA